jgi:hypothetical protein
MSDIGDVWELRQGDTLMGTLTITDQDMFDFRAHFEPTEEFQSYKYLFDEDSKLGSDDEAVEKMNQIQEEVNNLLDLVSLRDGKHASLFILHIRSNTAGFRAIFENMK